MGISVIVATLDRPKMLAETLASVLACDPLPLEILIVDAGASSEVPDVIRRLTAPDTPPIRHIAAEPGLTRQRNLGLRAVTGDIVLFLDDDVTLEKDAFAILADAYLDPSVVGVTGRVIGDRARRVARGHRIRSILPGGGREGSFTRYGYPRYIRHQERTHDVEFLSGCCMSARASLAAEIGLDENLTGLGVAEDEDFSYRLSRRGRLRYLPDLVVHHHLGPRNENSRSLGRMVVVNRSYLFRKNFEATRLARAQFRLLVLMLLAHRIVNRDLSGARGVLEGAVETWRTGGPSLPLAPMSLAVQRDAVPVAFVSSHARAGGAEKYLERLVESLDPSWVRVVVSLEEGPLVERARTLSHPTEVIPTGPGRVDILRASWRLRGVLEKTRPAVVHANGIKAAVVSGLATVATGVPTIWVKCDFSMDGRIAALVASRCEEVIGVSRAVTRTFGPRPQKKVRVVYTGVPEVEASREQGRRLVLEAFGDWTPARVVVLVGRMDPDKGHRELLDIAPAIVEALPQTGFVFLGGHDLTSDYARGLIGRVADLGLERHVVFLPHRSDPFSLMAGCDLLVHSSLPLLGPDTEGFPLVALESLLVGTPVVGYANGGLPELVGDSGRIVPVRDREALRRAIVELLEDDELRTRLAALGQKRVRERFLLPGHVEVMKDRYRAVARQVD